MPTTRERLRCPSLRPPSKAGLKRLVKHLPLWLCALGWSLAYIGIGALLFDFSAAPVIWLLLIASSLLFGPPNRVVAANAVSPAAIPLAATPLTSKVWAPALTVCLALVGIALPAWAIFLTALPMSILFVSLTLIGNQPVKASLTNSLSVYGCSTVFISLVALLLSMRQGDRLSPSTALLSLIAIALILFFCTPPLRRLSDVNSDPKTVEQSPQRIDRLHIGNSRKRRLLWTYGAAVTACLGVGAWAVHSPWTIALLDPTIAPPIP